VASKGWCCVVLLGLQVRVIVEKMLQETVDRMAKRGIGLEVLEAVVTQGLRRGPTTAPTAHGPCGAPSPVSSRTPSPRAYLGTYCTEQGTLRLSR